MTGNIFKNIAADVRKALLNEKGEDNTQCGEAQGRLLGSLKLVQ